VKASSLHIFIFYSLREATLYLSILLISKTNLIT